MLINREEGMYHMYRAKFKTGVIKIISDIATSSRVSHIHCVLLGAHNLRILNPAGQF